MPTVPSGSAHDHLVRLREELSTFFPDIGSAHFRFRSLKDSVLFFGVELAPLGAAIESEAFEQVLERFIADGTQWVRLGGDGFLVDRDYLCTVDSSSESRADVSAILILGPPLGRNGAPIRTARTLIGFLEVVAERLSKRGEVALAERLLLLYERRRSGLWLHERLNDWRSAEIRKLFDTVAGMMDEARSQSMNLAQLGVCGDISNVSGILSRLGALLSEFGEG